MLHVLDTFEINFRNGTCVYFFSYTFHKLSTILHSISRQCEVLLKHISGEMFQFLLNYWCEKKDFMDPLGRKKGTL